MILIIALIAGPVGDYLGYDYQLSFVSQGYDSLYSPSGDEGDNTIFDTVTIIDTLTHLGHPAYLTHHIRISDLFYRYDTSLSWEIGDTLFGYISILDTIFAKLYVTPFYVGRQWDLGATGDTLTMDIDGDGIDDTLVVQNGESEVIDSLWITVPLGTFDAFKILTTMYLTGWQSLFDGPCRVWTREHQWLSAYHGVIRDSAIIIDSVKFFGLWIEAARMITYSEATDSGSIAIAWQQEKVFGSILPIVNGIRISGSGNYQIEVYDVLGRLRIRYDMQIDGTKKLRPELEAGAYFVRVKKGSQIGTFKFVIIR